ncbi:MAG: hypothetical protein R3301_17645 [Saprospiraceae bacterium]|nr:hypothetical protein [Saprospiraceae bacterium]
MDPSILAALIAAGVSLLIAFASFLWNQHNTRKEMRLKLEQAKEEVQLRLKQLREDDRRLINEQLIPRRLEVYPEVNEVILQFMHAIRTGGIKPDHVKTMHERLKAWELHHSLLLTFKSRATYSDLMMHLRTIRHQDHTELKTLKSLIDCIGKLRLALKGDLGIFRAEFRDSDDGYFQTYDELFAHQQKEDEEKQAVSENDAQTEAAPLEPDPTSSHVDKH